MMNQMKRDFFDFLDMMGQMVDEFLDSLVLIKITLLGAFIKYFLIVRRFLVRCNLINGRKYTICDQSQIDGKTLEDLFGLTISGKQLKQILGSMPLLKFMHDDDQHYGMKYQTGANEDLLEFENSSSCSRGGIYVTTLDNCMHYVGSYGFYARQVSIDDDALVYVENDKLKCNKVTLGPRVEKNQLIRQLLSEFMNDNKSEDKEPGIIRMFDQSPALFRYIRIDDQNEDLAIRLIDRLRNCLYRIYDRYIFDRPRISMKLIEIDGTWIKNVPEHLITNEIILVAVKQNGFALRYVDHEQRTQEHIVAALKQNPDALVYLDKNEMTQQLVDIAINTPDPTVPFQYIMEQEFAKKYITYEMMIDVVKKNGMLIEYIDKHMLTPLLVSEAVRQNGLAIQYIDDEEYLTHSVILDAIQSDPDAIDWIANEEIAKIIKNLVNGPMDQGTLAKQQTSEHMLTPHSIFEEVRRNGLAIRYVDKEHLTHSLMLVAIQSNPDAIDLIANEEIAEIIKNLVNGPGPDPMDQGALAKEQTSEEQTNEEQTSEEQTSEEQTSDMYAINRCFY
jgi:ribosomal protein L12E/L44/L45/RPP1/RPP2